MVDADSCEDLSVVTLQALSSVQTDHPVLGGRVDDEDEGAEGHD